MKNRKKNSETVALALSLFILAGFGVAYNLYSSEDGEASVSVSRFAEEWLSIDIPTKRDAISDCTRANLESFSVVQASLGESEFHRTTELLPPIVKPTP